MVGRVDWVGGKRAEFVLISLIYYDIATYMFVAKGGGNFELVTTVL